jgi:hypothetical protein
LRASSIPKHPRLHHREFRSQSGDDHRWQQSRTVQKSLKALLREQRIEAALMWQYFTCQGQGCNLSRGTGPLPTRAVRLRNGHTLISDQYNHRVIEVNHGKQIVRTFGKLGALGYNTESVAAGGLNSPYDANKSATTPA